MKSDKMDGTSQEDVIFYFEVLIKDKLFKSIKWTIPSVMDGILEILMDGSSQKGENIRPMNGRIYHEVQ